MPFNKLRNQLDYFDTVTFYRYFHALANLLYRCRRVYIHERSLSGVNYAGFKKKEHSSSAAPLIRVLCLFEVLHLSPLYKWVYEMAAKDSFASIEKAKKSLALFPAIPTEKRLSETTNGILKTEILLKYVWVSHRVPWKQGVLGFAKVFF